jgi:hypothetical protein
VQNVPRPSGRRAAEKQKLNWVRRAINRSPPDGGLRWLADRECMDCPE